MLDCCVIDLLRHGDTGMRGYHGSLDDPLTELGWRQMYEAVHVETKWNAIISSPMTRCAEFAKVYAALTGLPLEFDSRFREIHFGDWEGQSAEQLLNRYAVALKLYWSNPWCYTPPNGESLEKFERRVRDAWTDIASRYWSRRILLITHGGIIRMLLYLSRSLSRTKFLNLSVPHASLHTVISKPGIVK